MVVISGFCSQELLLLHVCCVCLSFCFTTPLQMIWLVECRFAVGGGEVKLVGFM
jgi:hypothetical protein